MASINLVPPGTHTSDQVESSDSNASNDGDQSIKTALITWRRTWESALEQLPSADPLVPPYRDTILLLSKLIHLPNEYLNPNDPRIPKLARTLLPNFGWWQVGTPTARARVAVVSSRLPRVLDPTGSWMQGLRFAIHQAKSDSQAIVTSSDTAGGPIIQHGANEVRLPIVRLLNGPALASTTDLLEHFQDATDRSTTTLIAIPEDTNIEPSDLDDIPLPDRALLGWSDHVMVLGLRRGGNWHRLLEHRLHHDPHAVGLIDLPELQSPSARRDALDLGAQLLVADHHEVCSTALTATSSDSAPTSPIALADQSGDYLTHTTRACPGPWPDQSFNEYLNDLWHAGPHSDHSAFGTLMWILRTGQLRASGKLIRGGYQVVSFTSLPLSQVKKKRVFRVHRSKWDFEPYGISIRRSYLESLGARPVTYGDDDTWNSMDEATRPYFQAMGATTDEAGKHAWTAEQEWRHVGDVQLNELPSEHVLVIVRTEDEARVVRANFTWPVTVLS